MNNDPGTCGIIVTGIAPTIIENCPADSVSYVLTGATLGSGLNDASGTIFNVGVTTVTYVAVDVANNADTCMFTVTINDNELPTMVCPPNVVVNNDSAMCSAIITSGIEPISFGDNCIVDSVSYVLTGATVGSGLNNANNITFNVGITTVIFTVTDTSSNSFSCSFTVTVMIPNYQLLYVM